MKNKLLKIIIPIALGICSTALPRFFAPTTVAAFDKILTNFDLAVIHFNPFGIGDVPEDEEEVVEDMKQDFLELSQENRYRNVAFIGVNTARLPALAQRYNIDPAAKATVVLYKDGNEYKEAKRKTGYLTKGQMRAYVEKYFGDIIDKLATRYPSERIVTRTYQPTTYRYSYPVYDYDYDDSYTYYYPRYRYRPYFWGGYPYYGGWGPGFGFNVGAGNYGFGIGFGF
jgi:hypothetical protein